MKKILTEEINNIKNLINRMEGKKVITEGFINEALNKDMMAFARDVNNRVRQVGFKTELLRSNINNEQRELIEKDPKLVVFVFEQGQASQNLDIICNKESKDQVKAVVDKYQLAKYSGETKAVDKGGWNDGTKQVQGAHNPGDILLNGDGFDNGLYWIGFIRTKDVHTRTKTTKSVDDSTSYTDGETRSL